MSEQADTEDKTEEPTQKKLLDAKKKGQVARSKELSTALVTLSAAAMFMAFGITMLHGMMDVVTGSLLIERDNIFDSGFIVTQLTQMTMKGLLLIVPFAAVMLLATLIAPALIGGWSFSAEAITFKPEKLDPIKGLKKVFSMKGLVELVKAVAKFVLVGIVSAAVIYYYSESLLSLSNQSIDQALAGSGALMVRCFLVISTTLLFIAAFDVPYQLYEHAKQLRMTKQEVKDENKDTEGRPEVKGKLRELQQQFANNRMMEDVPLADVIVINPTHYSVALKYEAMNMAAPIVVAKGVDNIALQIRMLAKRNNVAVMESPALARALYGTTDIGQEIPGGLYKAVAQVLTYVYQLKQWEEYGGDYPHKPEVDFDREEFDY